MPARLSRHKPREMRGPIETVCVLPFFLLPWSSHKPREMRGPIETQKG